MQLLGLALLLLLSKNYAALELSAPSPQQAFLGTNALLSCHFSLDNAPVNHQFLAVFWYHQGKEILIYDNKGKTHQPRISFNEQAAQVGNVSLTVSNVRISDGGIYKCLVIYSPETKEKEITLDILAQPVIKITKKGNRLTCKAFDFHPMNISFTWLHNKQTVKNVLLDKLQQSPDGTYHRESSVEVTAASDESNQTFSCRVQHASLQHPLQEDYQLVHEDNVVVVATVVVIAVLVAVIIIGIVVWNRRKKKKNLKEFKLKDIQGPKKLIDGEEVILSCTGKNCPGKVQMVWLEKTSNGEYQIPEPKTGYRDETMNLLDHLYVVESKMEEYSYTSSLRFNPCIVRHKEVTFTCIFTWDGNTKEKSQLYTTELSGKPIVEGIQTPQLLHETPVTLQCNISKYFPDALTVTWLRRGEGSQELSVMSSNGSVSIPDVKSNRDPDNTYSCTARLTITPTLRAEQGVEYICRVVHPKLEQPIERSTGKLRVMAKPKEQDPVQITLQDGNRLKFILTLKCFYPKDINITWNCNKSLKHLKYFIDNKTTENADNSYDVTGTFGIPGDPFHDPTYKVIVTWKHEATDTEESKEMSARDFPWRPQVEDIMVEKSQSNQDLTLKCKISKYFPKDVIVFWYKKESGSEVETALNSSKYKVSLTKEKKDKDMTFFCEASMTISYPLGSDQRAEFICKVKHPTLDQPIEKRIGAPEIGRIVSGLRK